MNQKFDDAIANLDAGFVLHELEKGTAEVTNVGIVIDTQSMKLRHARKPVMAVVPMLEALASTEEGHWRVHASDRGSHCSLLLHSAIRDELLVSHLQVHLQLAGWS